MNKGIQILLERMESTPDEFLPEMAYGSAPEKWSDVMQAVYARVHGRQGSHPYYDLSFLSDEEIKAVFNKLQSIRADQFTKEIMARLLTDDSSQEATRHSAGVGSSSQIKFQTGIQATKANLSIGKHTLTDEKMELLELLVKEQQLKIQAELQRKYMDRHTEAIKCK